MNEIKQPSRYKGVERRKRPRGPAAVAGAAGISRDAYTNLLKRSDKVGGRHAAITDSLYSWHSYKNWAERMRGSWERKD